MLGKRKKKPVSPRGGSGDGSPKAAWASEEWTVKGQHVKAAMFGDQGVILLCREVYM